MDGPGDLNDGLALSSALTSLRPYLVSRIEKSLI